MDDGNTGEDPQKRQWSFTEYPIIYDRIFFLIYLLDKKFLKERKDSNADENTPSTPSLTSSTDGTPKGEDMATSMSNLTVSSTEGEEFATSMDTKTLVELVKEELEALKYRTFRLAMSAPQFDADPSCPGNGIRSLLRICDLGLKYFSTSLKEATNFMSVTFRRKKTELNAFYFWLKPFNYIVKEADLLMDEVSPDNLFPASLKNEDMERLLTLCVEPFYGGNFGVQFQENMPLKLTLSGLLVAMSSYSDGFRTFESDAPQKLAALIKSPLYLSSNRIAKPVAKLMMGNDIDFLKKFWNLQETVAFVSLDTTLRTPSPEIDHVFHINSGTIEMNHRNKEGQKVVIIGSELFTHIQLRLISAKKREGQKKEKGTPRGEGVLPPHPHLIFHVHGGGFVAQTSKAHLNYLRVYAKNLGAPILSVDYTLAPEAQYPTQLLQVCQAYCWAVNNAELLGSTAERIIVTGDSAGGNLILALTLWAIEHNIRIPDGVVAMYPATLARPVPSPARYMSVMDPMLGTGILLTCLKCYTNGNYPEYEPFLSPLQASDEALSLFPPCDIVVGEMDVLLDDSVQFAKRLYTLKKQVRLIVCPGLPHGFLGFSHSLRCCESATKEVVMVLEQHLKNAFLPSATTSSTTHPLPPSPSDLVRRQQQQQEQQQQQQQEKPLLHSTQPPKQQSSFEIFKKKKKY